MNQLHKKLGIKEQSKVIFLNAEEDFLNSVKPLPRDCTEEKQLRGTYNVVVCFAKIKNEVLKITGKLVAALDDSAALWIAYPKKGSGIETDLNRDKCWDVFSEFGFRSVNLISLNSSWSAMRFKPVKDISNKHSQVQNSDEFSVT